MADTAWRKLNTAKGFADFTNYSVSREGEIRNDARSDPETQIIKASQDVGLSDDPYVCITLYSARYRGRRKAFTLRKIRQSVWPEIFGPPTAPRIAKEPPTETIASFRSKLAWANIKIRDAEKERDLFKLQHAQKNLEYNRLRDEHNALVKTYNELLEYCRPYLDREESETPSSEPLH